MAQTPRTAQKTKIARPMDDKGAKSPYPIDVKVMKPYDKVIDRFIGTRRSRTHKNTAQYRLAKSLYARR